MQSNRHVGEVDVQQSPQDRAVNTHDNAVILLGDLASAISRPSPTAPLLESVLIAPPSPVLTPKPKLNLPSRRASTASNPTFSTHLLATGPENAQLHLQNPQPNHDVLQAPSGPGVQVNQDPPVEHPIQKSEPPQKGATVSFDQLTAFWEKYNAIGDKEDKAFVASAGGDLDNLLIFAGLFSAVDTAFIIESYKGLKPDPADEATNLLRSVVLLLHNSTYTDESVTPSFTPTVRDVRVNCLLFASLCCSLSAAFGAVLAKQWLTQYDQDSGGSLKIPADRGRERHQKYEGRSKWHLEDVIVTLPTLLQLSLFFFLIGLADFIWPLSTPVASIIMTFAAATFLFYTISISISVIDHSSPFQTRLSALLSRTSTLPTRTSALFSRMSVFIASVWTCVTLPFDALHYRLRLYHKPYWTWPHVLLLHFATDSIPRLFKWVISLVGWVYRRLCTGGICQLSKSLMTMVSRTYHSVTRGFGGGTQTTTVGHSVESRCIVYLLKRMTVTEDLEILAEAIDSLPDSSVASEIANALTTFHLKPTLDDGQLRFPGLHGQSCKAMVKMLRAVSRNWESSQPGSSSTNSTPLLNNLQMREALALALWDMFLAHPEDQEVYDSTRQIYLTLSRGERDPTPSCHSYFLSREAIMTNLNTAAVQERTIRLACLLPTIGCDLYHTMALLRITASESPQFVDMLRSTMWRTTSHRPDLEIFWLATFRVRILSSNHLNTLVDSHFPEYIASWFKHFALPDWEAKFPSNVSNFRYEQSREQQLSLYWTYLFSLRHLLHQTSGRNWPQELTAAGHLACLHILLQEYPHNFRFCGKPLGLWALLCLWNQEKMQGGSEKSLFLTKACIQLVTSSFMLCSSYTGWIAEMAGYPRSPSVSHLPVIWSSMAEVAEDIIQMLGWLFAYLEAAKEGGLMEDEDLAKSMVQAYSHWWTELNLRLPEDHKYMDQSAELYTKLFGYVQLA